MVGEMTGTVELKARFGDLNMSQVSGTITDATVAGTFYNKNGETGSIGKGHLLHHQRKRELSGVLPRKHHNHLVPGTVIDNRVPLETRAGPPDINLGPFAWNRPRVPLPPPAKQFRILDAVPLIPLKHLVNRVDRESVITSPSKRVTPAFNAELTAVAQRNDAFLLPRKHGPRP